MSERESERARERENERARVSDRESERQKKVHDFESYKKCGCVGESYFKLLK